MQERHSWPFRPCDRIPAAATFNDDPGRSAYRKLLPLPTN